VHQVLGTILALIKGSDLINLIKKNGLLYYILFLFDSEGCGGGAWGVT
jgi:hypothetical protein